LSSDILEISWLLSQRTADSIGGNDLTSLKLVFVGTGGGRFITSTQKIHTGGIRFISDFSQIHLDPGPGALVYSLSLGLNQTKLDAILVSHCHLDHYGDTEVMIESMTKGGTSKQGTLLAPRSVLYGEGDYSAAISKYHKSIIKDILEAKVQRLSTEILIPLGLDSGLEI
jgi:phosphoribosyl 1,2-cyclic phosphodiesterase